jgi:hypothetical protein
MHPTDLLDDPRCRDRRAPVDAGTTATAATFATGRRATSWAPLLAAAAHLDPDDPAWDGLRRQAHDRTRDLALRGQLPAGLLVDLDDPPVVVARTLAHLARR